MGELLAHGETLLRIRSHSQGRMNNMGCYVGLETLVRALIIIGAESTVDSRRAPMRGDQAELTIAAIVTEYAGQCTSIRAGYALNSADEDGRGSLS